MKNTIIGSIVAILCTAAICITAVFCFAAGKSANGYGDLAKSSDYLTEAEAAEYIGVTVEEMQLMRVNLKYFEGAYVSYSYLEDAKNIESNLITDVVYNKDALNDAVAKVMEKNNAVNFKYIQNSLAKTEK